MEVGGQRHAPAALPPEKTWYPLYRSLGGPQSRSVRVRKISLQPGFDPRNVQPHSKSLYRRRYPGLLRDTTAFSILLRNQSICLIPTFLCHNYVTYLVSNLL
jgi:hypothetical protein